MLSTSLRNSKDNIGIISDTHHPFCLPGYLEHCYDTFNYFKCSRVVHIGDCVDSHAVSYHDHSPDGMSAGLEHEAALVDMGKWYKTFPKVDVMRGNHDALYFRKAYTHGLPKCVLKSYKEIWEAPAGWNWHDKMIMLNILFEHGTGSSGRNGAINRAMDNRLSTVIGHIHSFAGVQFVASERDLIFGFNVGCGLDANAYSMAYGKDFSKKPTIGCGVVLDGRVPMFVPMDLGSKIKFKK